MNLVSAFISTTLVYYRRFFFIWQLLNTLGTSARQVCPYIYIPILIDLKDRRDQAPPEQAEIYIPIWIDLKAALTYEHQNGFCIYIPIWIDLKGFRPTVFVKDFNHLHSNMDRFERRCTNSTVVIISYHADIVNVSYKK